MKKLKQNIDVSIALKGDLEHADKLLLEIEKSSFVDVVQTLKKESSSFGIIVDNGHAIFAATDRVRGYSIYYNTETLEVSFNGNELVEPLSEDTLTNADTLLEFCMSGYVLGQNTLHQDLKTLQAGEYLYIDKTSRTLKVERYYSYAPCPAAQKDTQKAQEELNQLLDQAILRTIAQAKGHDVWVPLSGGIDSRLILAKLHEHGATNLKAFSYGTAHNDEAQIAQQIAARLNVPWHMIEAKPKEARALYQSDLRQAYEDFTHSYSCIPSYVEFEAIHRLKQSGLAAPGSFIVNGQTGDFLSGDHIPASLYENDTPTEADLLDYIIAKHFSIWHSLKTPKNLTKIKDCIRARLIDPASSLSQKDRLISQYESFEWAERQAKMVIQGQRTYDYFGFNWSLPLWDSALMDFFETLPNALKYKQKLYMDYVRSYNYLGLFDLPRAKVHTWRAPWRYFYKATGKVIELFHGKAAKENFYKSMSYYGHHHDQYALFGREMFKKHQKGLRNIISLSIYDFLECRGIAFPTDKAHKKIAFFIFSLGGGGAEKMAAKLMTHWATQGHDVTCYTFDDGSGDVQRLPDTVKHIPLNIAPPPPDNMISKINMRFNHIRTLRQIIKSEQPDVAVSFVFVTNILLILSTLGLRIKTIIAERNDPARQSEGRFWDFLRKLTYKHANHVTANSRNALDTLGQFVPEAKLTFTANALNTPENQYLIPQSEKDNLILCTARLHPQKDHVTLLKAFADIHEQYPDWRLTLAGAGQEEQRLKSLAHKLNINEKISFLGHVANPYTEYARAKIFVLPSLHEGTPNAPLEAMSCGIPAIVSSTTYGALEFIQNPEQIFHVGDPHDLANKLRALIDSPIQQDQASKAGMEAVKALQSEDIFQSWDRLL